MPRILRPATILAALVLAGTALPAAARTTPTTVPKKAAAVACLASPGQTLAWIAGVRDLAGRLDLPVAGLDLVSRVTRERAGADLLTTAGWTAAGLRADLPVCAWGPVGRDKDVAISFGVTSDARARDLVARLLAARDAPDAPPGAGAPDPVPETIGKFKAWRIGGGSHPLRAWFTVVDGTGIVATGRGAFEALGAGAEDRAKDLALPAGDVAVSMRVDLARFAEAVGDDDAGDLARDWIRDLRVQMALAGGELSVTLRAANGARLARIGTAAQAAKVGDALLDAVPADATGFARLRLPWPEVARALEEKPPAPSRASARENQKKKKGTSKTPLAPEGSLPRPGDGPGLLEDLAACLAGDVTLVVADGLPGTALVAGITDEAGCRKALDAALARAVQGGLALADDTASIDGVPVRTLRFGKPGEWFRFPVHLVLRPDRLVVALTPTRAAALAASSGGAYLRQVDHPDVAEGRTRGAALLSHGFEADSLGGLSAWAAVIRGALEGVAAAWMDLWDLPALALDLLYDSAMTADVGPKETVLAARARFLVGDPRSADPRARAYGQAIRLRVAGRTTAWRNALLDLSTGSDRYATRARRALVAPEPLADVALLGALAGVLAKGVLPGPDTPAEAATDPEMQCQEYAIAACMGRGPDSPECLDARRYLDLDRPAPLTPEEGNECQEKARAMEAGAGVETDL